MSGLFLVPPVIIPFMEVPTMLLALGLLGFELTQGTKILMCGKNKVQVDHVLQNENGLMLGVKVDAEGRIELHVDEDDLRRIEGVEVKDFEQQVQQKYQYTELKKRLTAEGYTIVEEDEETDQTVRLVVRRWR